MREKTIAKHLFIGDVTKNVTLHLKISIVRKSKYLNLYIDLNTGQKYKSNVESCKKGDCFVCKDGFVSFKDVFKCNNIEQNSKKMVLKKYQLGK